MEKLKGNILVVDDDPGVLQTAKFILKQSFEQVITEKELAKALKIQNDCLDQSSDSEADSAQPRLGEILSDNGFADKQIVE